MSTILPCMLRPNARSHTKYRGSFFLSKSSFIFIASEKCAATIIFCLILDSEAKLCTSVHNFVDNFILASFLILYTLNELSTNCSHTYKKTCSLYESSFKSGYLIFWKSFISHVSFVCFSDLICFV